MTRLVLLMCGQSQGLVFLKGNSIVPFGSKPASANSFELITQLYFEDDKYIPGDFGARDPSAVNRIIKLIPNKIFTQTGQIIVFELAGKLRFESQQSTRTLGNNKSALKNGKYLVELSWQSQVGLGRESMAISLKN